MRATLKLPPSIVLIEAALQGLVAANRVLIQTGIVPPSPLDTPVRYKREGSGLEEWNTATECLKLGYGDCEDLNCWECAGLQLEEDPDAQPHLVRTGEHTFHCVVLLSDGELHDVCPDLGMRRGQAGVRVSGLPWLEAEKQILGAREHRESQMTTRDKLMNAARQRRAEAWRKKRGRKMVSASSRGPKSRTTGREPTDETETTTMPPGTIPATVQPTNEPPSPPMEMPLMDDEEDFDSLPDEGLDDGGSAA